MTEILVDPDCQRRGIGRELMARALAAGSVEGSGKGACSAFRLSHEPTMDSGYRRVKADVPVNLSICDA